ncbi:MAG: pilus assembly PilX N-terminal domain-containing protein [Desulfovibrionales bacterium]|nr:pilus assembly PilX N-terminal domain-containing protein [Desulfovibrionales bacterium]
MQIAMIRKPHTVKLIGAFCRDERGIVLITALLFLMVLTILGTTAIVISSTDIKIGGNYKLSKQAFYDAEAGIQYAIKNIENGLAAETLSLTGSSVAVSYTAPSGFSFDPITTLTQVGTTSNYSFRATGHAANNTSSTIEVVVERETLLDYGIFGDDEIDMKNSGAAYSYDSRVTPNPTPADSTGEADIGSNKLVTGHNGTIIDGDVALGDDGLGTEGIYTPMGSPGPTVTGVEGVDVDRVDPDPLGAIGGDLAATFTAVSSGSNDNVWGGITGNTINLGNGDTMTLYGKSGGADYYVTDINLNNGATLNIDATAGAVNIYLTGGLDAKNGSAVNITGVPPDFTIYSNSTDKIDFKHGSAFKGTVYAPYADIDMKNSSEVYGILWGKTVDIKNSGQFYFDTALKDKFASDDISIVSWREVRE